MFSKKQLVIISFTLAVLFHFIFYFTGYGPSATSSQSKFIYIPAILSAIIIVFLYFATYWRSDLKGNPSVVLFDILVLWIFVCFVRSVLKMNSLSDMMPYLFYNYLGISLFPVLFFIAGLNSNYYNSVNKILTWYLVAATLVSLMFLKYFELQVFLLMPLFYIILTIPLRNAGGRVFILMVSATIIIVSLTNRAGILRILISYSVLLAYYIMRSVRISKKLITFLVFLLLMIPVVSLYLGIRGQSVFQTILGEDTQPYSQMNPYADTRTFLYYEVFQDLKVNNAFVFGKGLNATYASDAFQTFGRPMVEVGFLQILLKMGIVGVLLYLSVIVTAIYKSIIKSSSFHMKSLGLLLSGYFLMLFVENVVAYNLLNIVVWIIVGMCFSPKMRAMKDDEFKLLFNTPLVKK
jgi:hypothetical protein